MLISTICGCTVFSRSAQTYRKFDLTLNCSVRTRYMQEFNEHLISAYRQRLDSVSSLLFIAKALDISSWPMPHCSGKS